MNRYTWMGFRWFLLPIIAVPMVLTFAGCSSEVGLEFRLINPCDTNVLDDEGCQSIRVAVSPLGSQDGSRVQECPAAEGKCTVGASDLIGAEAIVDAQCILGQQDPPVARATSQVIEIKDSRKSNLLLGSVNGFVKTTYLSGENLGQCSMMAQQRGRYGHTATLLIDGRVLIVGGIQRFNAIDEITSTVEIFDPETGSHRQIVGLNATSGRAFHTATLLENGNVLIAGGVGLVEGKWMSLTHSEIFDARSETFPENKVAVMDSARAGHSATFLEGSGKVLASGGALYTSKNEISAYLDTAELYDPAANAWSPVSNKMSAGRASHQATALDANSDRGLVLITGGSNSGGVLDGVDIYNPSDNRFYDDIDITMRVARAIHCAVRLSSGEVLVAGGTTTGDYTGVDSGVEVYSSSAGGSYGGFKPEVVNLNTARMDHACTLLDNGDVLVAGGLTADGQAADLGELVSTSTGILVDELPDPMDPTRSMFAATRLRNGWVFFSGGLPDTDQASQAITQSVYFVPEAGL